MDNPLKLLPLLVSLTIISLAPTPPSSPVYAQEKAEETQFLSIVDKLVIIHQRMRAAGERLERFSERLDSRLTKLEQQGSDTSTARQLLDKAKARQRQADQEIINLDISISRAANSSPPHSETAATIEQVKKTKSALVETLEDVKKVVGETRRLSEAN
jgi:small-conductance mechanosensitive channel